MKFQNSSYSVRKNSLVKNFRKSQSNFPKNFLLRENRQKEKCCVHAISSPFRNRQTSELYHFQKPREKSGQRKQLHLWQVSKVSQLQYYLVTILQDNAFFTRFVSSRNAPPTNRSAEQANIHRRGANINITRDRW